MALIDRFPDPVSRLPGNQRRLRGLLVASFVALAWWATWVFDRRNIASPVFLAVVVASQVLDIFGVFGFWYAIWPRRRPEPLFAAVRGRGSLLILTQDQPIQVVEQTLQAAVAVRRRHRVFLADPSERPELRWLAGWYGVRRLSPGMEELDELAGARFLAVIEAGQVPRPEFLERLLPYFADRNVALVQAWCSRSGRHRAGVRDAILQGGDALGKAWCLGSNYVLRRSALHSIGGYGPSATSPAGALRLATALRADQWRTRYVSVRLTDSLGPSGLWTRLAEGRRWATAQVAATLRPGSRRRGASASARFYTAWAALRYPALLGLPVSAVAVTAYATLEPVPLTWIPNLAVHVTPYLVLRAVVRLVLAARRPAREQPALQPEGEVPLPGLSSVSTDGATASGVVEAEALEVEPAPEPEAALEPASTAEEESHQEVEAEPRAAEQAPAEPDLELEPAAMADVKSQQEMEPAARDLFTLVPELEPELHLGWKVMSSPGPEAPPLPQISPRRRRSAARPSFALAAASQVTTGLRAAVRGAVAGLRPGRRPPAVQPLSEVPSLELELPIAEAEETERAGEPVSIVPAQPEVLEVLSLPAEPSPAPESELASELEPEAGLELEPEPDPDLELESKQLAASVPTRGWQPWPRLKSRHQPRALRPRLALVAAWVLTTGVIGAAAFAVIQSNPPQGPASVPRVSTPPYSYYAPVQPPSGGAQPSP